MNLTVERSIFTDKSTIGSLYVNGAHFCHTLEDVDRHLEEGGKKIQNQTAIPCGTYHVIISYSPHFGYDLPLLLGVDGYEGVRIHKGNTDIDTEGCILVGETVGQDFIGNSAKAFDRLFPLLKQAYDNKEPIKIEVKRINTNE